MADWEEVKRLAADFQKVQLTSTTQKLSERNCVEIVSWLIDRKIIDLIFTTDGKEYLTTSELMTSIQNELYISGGRINLVELSKIIGVDLAHINAHLNEVLKGNKDIHNVLGQLVNTAYLMKIAGEINEKLQQQGEINIGELTIHYDLPADFLQQLIEKYLGRIIFGKQDKSDPKVFFTESFIAGCKAKIQGALAGLTTPTSVATILNHINLSEKLFFSLFDQCITYGTLSGKLTGAQYIPTIYARSQNEWVNNFYKQNNYLEYDSLTRLGITDHKSYLKKMFSSEELIFLNSVVVNKALLNRVDADIDECIISKSYVDIQNSLTSVFTSEDISMVLSHILAGSKAQQTVVLDSYVLSKSYIETLENTCLDMVKEKATNAVESGNYQKYLIELQGSQNRSQKTEDIEEKVDKREERRKRAAGGKSGGGVQGRETKTKSVKKHSRGLHKSESEDTDSKSSKSFEVVSKTDIEEIIKGPLEDEGLDDLIDPITEMFVEKLNKLGLEAAASIFATTVADKTASRRQTHSELQNKLNLSVNDIRLFEKGIKLLPLDLQTALTKYLLKTICADIVTEILNYVSSEANINTSTDNFNNDQRIKFVNELPSEFKAALLPLVKSLSGQSIEEFMNTVDSALASCSMILKKIDKKKDHLTIMNHKMELLDKMSNCDDPALVLHLTVLVIFTVATQCMIHASGRHVTALLSFLKTYLNEEELSELLCFHDLVTVVLSNGPEAETARDKLKEKIHTIKKIANEFKKPAVEKKAAN